MDTVLTFDVLKLEDEWNADYEKVEASIKKQVADLIFEELLNKILTLAFDMKAKTDPKRYHKSYEIEVEEKERNISPTDDGKVFQR